MHMRIWCTTSYSYSQLAAAGHGHIRTARSTDISRKPGDLPVYRLASYISCSASATVHGMLASDRSRSIWDIDIPRAWARDGPRARARCNARATSLSPGRDYVPISEGRIISHAPRHCATLKQNCFIQSPD